MITGTIVLLNGTSSSGKTLIARAFQEIMPGYFIHTGIDHYLDRVSPNFSIPSDGINPATAPGLLWVYSPLGQVVEIRIGPVALAMFRGMYRAYAALVAEGNNLIVDDVIFDRRILDAAVTALVADQTVFVGVRCPLEIAEQREKERGDRNLGLVRAHYELVHAHGIYDLEIDTFRLTPMQAALEIKAWLDAGEKPQAFRKLARQRIE